MDRIQICRYRCFTIMAAGLALASGCCCHDRGFVLHGDWSVQMDRLPDNCSHGPSCGCFHGHSGWQPDAASQASAAPIATPRFHPLPTAPVADVMSPAPPPVGPHLTAAPHAAPQAARPEVRSVIKPKQQPSATSWMFVRRSGQPAPPDLDERRRLAADAWSTPRRR
jgi:hypothetical protein